MREMDSEFFMDVWNLLKEYVLTKERETAAHRLADVFEDYGLEIEELYRLEGEDKYLDRVIKDRHQSYDEDDEEGYTE